MHRSHFIRRLVSGLILLAGSPVAAQGTSSNSNGPSIWVPQVMVGAGLGTVHGIHLSGAPIQTFTIQFIPHRHLTLDGEASFWSESWRRTRPGYTLRGPRGETGYSGDSVASGTSSGWSAGLNLLYRTEPRRLTGVAGAGISYSDQDARSIQEYEGCVAPGFERSCLPTFQFGERDRGPQVQGVAGIDVQTIGRLRAYADVRIAPAAHAAIRVTGGIRVVAVTRPPSADSRRRARQLAGLQSATTLARRSQTAIGSQVRVTLATGERRVGRLVGLTDTDVTVFSNLEPRRYPLGSVLLIETAHHGARTGALLGLLAGFVVGYAGSCGSGDEEDCWPEVGAMVGGAGAGIGAASAA